MTRSSDPADPPGLVRVVETSQGRARVTIDAPDGAAPADHGTLVLGHGAGGGVDSVDLAALAAAAAARGLRTARVEQPWRVAGKRIAPAPARLDAAWYEILAALGEPGPLVLGGRSAGARVACRTAERVGAVAVIALAFPLHPPGRPERSRVDELRSTGVPVFVVQGERDAFGRPGEFPPEVPLHVVPAADHGFAVPAALRGERDGLLAAAANAAVTWCDNVVKPQE